MELQASGLYREQSDAPTVFDKGQNDEVDANGTPNMQPQAPEKYMYMAVR